LEILQSGESIPAEYKAHPLSGNQKGFRDLHIEPDWVLIYKEIGDIIVVLAATGSHSHLFK
jgi:mRNA interferase YafQ